MCVWKLIWKLQQGLRIKIPLYYTGSIFTLCYCSSKCRLEEEWVVPVLKGGQGKKKKNIFRAPIWWMWQKVGRYCVLKWIAVVLYLTKLEKYLQMPYHLHDLIINSEFSQHVYCVHSAMPMHVVKSSICQNNFNNKHKSRSCDITW